MLLFRKDIFIVEDQPASRLIYLIALGYEGANLSFDRWGRESIQKLKRLNHLDLIILDLMLPGGQSGFEIYKDIRAISSFDNIPVIAVSAADEAASQAQALGFSGFISKPIDHHYFPKQIRRIIEGEALWFWDIASSTS